MEAAYRSLEMMGRNPFNPAICMHVSGAITYRLLAGKLYEFENGPAAGLKGLRQSVSKVIRGCLNFIPSVN